MRYQLVHNRGPAGLQVVVCCGCGSLCRYELATAQSATAPRRRRLAGAGPRPVSERIVDFGISCSFPFLEVMLVLRQIIAKLIGDVPAHSLDGAREYIGNLFVRIGLHIVHVSDDGSSCAVSSAPEDAFVER